MLSLFCDLSSIRTVTRRHLRISRRCAQIRVVGVSCSLSRDHRMDCGASTDSGVSVPMQSVYKRANRMTVLHDVDAWAAEHSHRQGWLFRQRQDLPGGDSPLHRCHAARVGGRFHWAAVAATDRGARVYGAAIRASMLRAMWRSSRSGRVHQRTLGINLSSHRRAFSTVPKDFGMDVRDQAGIHPVTAARTFACDQASRRCTERQWPSGTHRRGTPRKYIYVSGTGGRWSRTG